VNRAYQWLLEWRPAPTPTPSSDLADRRWLQYFPPPSLEAQHLLAGLVEVLNELGLPLSQLSFSLLPLHPLIYAVNLNWTRHKGTSANEISYEFIRNVARDWAPMFLIKEGGGPMRQRLDVPAAELRWGLLREYASNGAIEYAQFPLAFSDGRRSFINCTTQRAGGFREEELAIIAEIIPVLALRVELLSSYVSARRLLDVYLGQNAAERVLSGGFRRGFGQLLNSAIWYCDLRGFTALSDRLPTTEVVPLLDRYFETVAGPVVARGGEILKFIGDAMLAVFAAGPEGPREACERALAAAEASLEAVAPLRPLSIGIGLHVGEVMYGNIGASERLDFTVIGATVNEVCRVESLCKELSAPLLMTGRFAEQIGGRGCVPLGLHALKGVSEPQPVFTREAFRKK
jgi:adenylate cyclase